MKNRNTARRGFTLIEMVAAAAVLGGVMVMTYQAVSAAAGQHRAAVRRQAALREAANALERLATLPWEDLTPEAAKAIVLSPEGRESLPGAQLRAEIVPSPDDPGAKRISVEVGWPGAAGQSQTAVRLAAWRFVVQASRLQGSAAAARPSQAAGTAAPQDTKEGP